MNKELYPVGKEIKEFKGKDIPDLYQVKFRPRGQGYEYRYGVVDTFDNIAKKLWKHKILKIDDAILNIYHEVTIEDFEVIPLECIDSEYDEYVDKKYQEAEKVSKKAKGLIGKMFRIGVGDGNAFYVVTAETPRTATVEWRGYCIDRWYDHAFCGGGVFDKKMVQSHVKREDCMQKIFSKSLTPA